MISIYELKPRFQALLRPLVTHLARLGVTANQVTVFALAVSCLLGVLLLSFGANQTGWFLLLPLWMFLRMALNAIDGMLAKEFAQKSPLGAYLNELSDVLADAALFLPFAFVAPFSWQSVTVLIFLATVSEMAGALGPMIGVARQYAGPMGKSDRAFLFGVLGLWLGLQGSLPVAVAWVLPIASLLIVLNSINRVRQGLSALAQYELAPSAKLTQQGARHGNKG